MAIDIHTKELPLSPAQARSYIQKNTDEFGIFFDKDRCYELSAILQLEMLDITRKVRRLALEPSLNLNDKNPGKIVVRGGTFYDFDPSRAETEPGGLHNYVDDGYKVIKEGKLYTVVKK